MGDGPMKSLDFVVRVGDTLWTESALKVWWLTKYRRYRIITVRQVPYESTFRGVRYTKRWLLGRKGHSAEFKN
jgi:hypothetical protein